NPIVDQIVHRLCQSAILAHQFELAIDHRGAGWLLVLFLLLLFVLGVGEVTRRRATIARLVSLLFILLLVLLLCLKLAGGRHLFGLAVRIQFGLGAEVVVFSHLRVSIIFLVASGHLVIVVVVVVVGNLQ